MSEKQRNQILEQAESQFQDVLQKARQAFDMIDDNAETMDGASGMGDMTAYEAVQHACIEDRILCDSEVQGVLSGLRMRQLVQQYGGISETEAHSIELCVTLKLVRGLKADLQSGMPIVDVVLDAAPCPQEVFEILVGLGKHGRQNRMDDFRIHSGTDQMLKPILCEIKHSRVESRFAHSGKVQIKPLGLLDFRECIHDRADLIAEIVDRCVPMESDFGAVAERALHRTPFLSADECDPFLRKINSVMLDTMDLLFESKEVSLHVLFLPVVAN